MKTDIKIKYSDTFGTVHSRDYYKGKSFHYSGEWTSGSHYFSDDYNVDFVVKNNCLLACSQSHFATIDNEPKDFILDENKVPIGISSRYWDFVLCGLKGVTPHLKIEDGCWHVSYNDGETWQRLGDAAAYQKPETGIPKEDLSSDVQDSLNLANTAVQPEDIAEIATTGNYADLIDSPAILWEPGVGVNSAILNESESTATGVLSVAEGSNTEANNPNEHSFGKYNKSNTSQYSNSSTLQSIGIGTSNENRKNAVEVMQNGDVYIAGIGNYNGTNPTESDSLQEHLSNLQSNINDKELVVSAALNDLNRKQEKRIQYHTTEYWNNKIGYIPDEGDIIIYSDYKTITVNGHTKTVPGIKIGSGNGYVQDLAFVDDELAQRVLNHTSNTTIHTTAEEKDFWNNKLNIDQYEVIQETLIFNRE